MANPYFKFKQFTVYHDLCAMKVGVDGVLLGAWANCPEAKSILDIGTGSGLIALMLAQKTDAIITAIDIDEGAFRQSILNFKNSPWFDRLNSVNLSLQEFQLQSLQKFDCIVSNPPFFVDSLKPDENSRTLARHTDTLSHRELLQISSNLLHQDGKIYIILPTKEAEILVAENKSLYCSRKMRIYSKPGMAAHRILLEFSLQECSCTESELTIETEVRHNYSPEYRELTKDYYLKF